MFLFLPMVISNVGFDLHWWGCNFILTLFDLQQFVWSCLTSSNLCDLVWPPAICVILFDLQHSMWHYLTSSILCDIIWPPAFCVTLTSSILYDLVCDLQVLVLKSLRQPKRITIRGSDEKDHMFLVKCGEDLRLDHRLETLFSVMNQVYALDPMCRQRKLQLRTYKVIPMTTRWVKSGVPMSLLLSMRLGVCSVLLTENLTEMTP